MKLSKLGNYLKQLGLLNDKYLMKRGNSYYFVLKIGNSVIKKSLFNDNYIYSNILKYKLLYEVNKLKKENEEKFGKPLKLFGANKIYVREKGFSFEAETEEEERLIEEFLRTIKNKTSRLQKEGYNTRFVLKDDTKDEETSNDNDILLKDALNQFHKQLERQQEGNKKYITKFNQAYDYLKIFFGENKKIRIINQNDAVNFLEFLQQVPKNFKNIKELQDKNIKSLIEKDAEILKKYDKQALSTIDEVVKKCKTIFNYLETKMYIIKNPFNVLKKTANKKSVVKTKWLSFKPEMTRTIFRDLEKKELFEEFNFMKTLLLTGMRRTELSLLKVKNIKLSEMYIDLDFDIDEVKNENAKRIIPIHKDLIDTLLEQLKGKTEEEFLFFDKQKFGKTWKIERRSENIGINLNKLIAEHIKENKNQYVLHSFRKNFIQEVQFAGLFQDELDYNTITGHSSESNTTEAYLLGMRNYKRLGEQLNKISFNHYFNIKKDICNKQNKGSDKIINIPSFLTD